MAKTSGAQKLAQPSTELSKTARIEVLLEPYFV